MLYNPYSKQVRDLEMQIDELESQITSKEEELTWYESFDEHSVESRLHDDLIILGSYDLQIQEADSTLKSIRQRIEELSPDSPMSQVF